MAHFDFYKQQDKHFFAGLFNTAIDNYELSLKELFRRSRYPKQANMIKSIEYAFAPERPLFEKEKNYKILAETLIFLNRFKPYISQIVDDNKKKDKTVDFFEETKELLKVLYLILYAYRNYYTHHEHPEVVYTFDKKDKKKIYIGNLIPFLNNLLFTSANNVKKGKAKTELVIESLYANHKKEFEQYVKEYNKKNKGKEKVKEKDKKNFVINRMFRYFIDDKGDNFKLRNSVVVFNENHFTTSGFVLLLSLFIDKKQIALLFDNVSFVNSDMQLQRKIAKWVYTDYAYKSIRYFFKSDMDEDALFLQMAQELSKAPVALYPHLSEKDKADFVEAINAYEVEGTGFSDTNLLEHEIIRKRYQEKFVYFALRFLDDIIRFDNLRFQVNIGRFNHHTTQKKYYDNRETERNILERINVFERLSEVHRKKRAFFEKHKDLQAGWQEYPGPKYSFMGNSIGIWIDGIEIPPNEKQRDKRTPKREMLKALELEKAPQKPVAYMSVYELPALLYALLVNKVSSKDIENIIIGKIKQIQNAYSIPEAIQHEKIKRKVKKIRKFNGVDKAKLLKWYQAEKNADPLSEIRSKYRKPLKNEQELSVREKGQIATWLSNDIKRFTSKDIRKHWRSYQFSEFQAVLAFDYNHKTGKVKEYMDKELNLLKDRPFPFFLPYNEETVYEFYLTYLINRKEYIEKQIPQIEKGLINERLFAPLKNNRIKLYEDLNAYSQKKRTSPVMLPRGIFARDTLTARQAPWFEVSSDINKAQEFYKYKRIYQGKEKQYRITPALDKGIKQILDKNEPNGIKRSIYKNEQEIYRTMRNDYYILSMLKNYLEKDTEIDQENLRNLILKDFYLTKAEKEAQKLKSKEFQAIDESFVLKKRVNINMYDGKLVDTVALKDAGKYKRYLMDGKIKLMISYFGDKVWNIDEIREQMNNYELVRSKQLFETIHALEKEIYMKALENNDLDTLLHKGYPNFRKYLTYYFLKNQPNLRSAFEGINVYRTHIDTLKDEKLKNLFVLIMIRNKFAHNQLLPEPVFRYIEKEMGSISLDANEKIGDYLNKAFQFFKKRLK